MLRIGSEFSKVVEGYAEYGETISVPGTDRLREIVEESCEAMDVEMHANLEGGQRILLGSGVKLERKLLYALVPAFGVTGGVENNITEAVLKMLEHIGPGRLWLLRGTVHMLTARAVDSVSDGRMTTRRGPDGDHLILAMYYWHEPVSVTPPDPWSVVDEALKREAERMKIDKYSAPGEPLRVKMSKYGTFTISDHLWTVQEIGGSPSEPGWTRKSASLPDRGSMPPEWRYDAKPPVLDGGIWLRSRPGEKHGPNETGASGPCDVDCRKCQAERIIAAQAAARPRVTEPEDDSSLWTIIDGQHIRDLVNQDQRCQRQDDTTGRRYMTPRQRAAVSAHWSTELRAKVEASRAAAAETEPSVRYCEVEPWE